jgi:hypothetical protein
MEMRNDDIRQVIEIHARLFKPNDRVTDTIHKDRAFLSNNDQVRVLMVLGRYCVG